MWIIDETVLRWICGRHRRCDFNPNMFFPANPSQHRTFKGGSNYTSARPFLFFQFEIIPMLNNISLLRVEGPRDEFILCRCLRNYSCFLRNGSLQEGQ
jgi:hypothetical protein